MRPAEVGHRLSDQELWDSAIAGLPEAFGQLFDRHHRAIYNYCFRRSGSWTIAEDLTATVFLEVWRTRRKMTLQAGSLLPWLYGVATRVSGRQVRSTTRQAAAFSRLAGREDSVADDPAEDVVDRLEGEQQMRAILRSFTKLPQREQDVLALALFGELDYADISVALGIPVGTVRSRLSRGRARLKQIVDQSQTQEEGGHR